MNTKEALEKIEEINTIVQSGNRIWSSGEIWIALGLYIFTIPVIGFFTQWLTFGHDFGASQVVYISIVNGFFFWGLAFLIVWFLIKRIRHKNLGVAKETVHPLIRKAWSINRPVYVSMAGIIIVFSITNQAIYIYPVIYIVSGLWFYVWGKFASPAMVNMAWSYVFGGLLFFYLRSYDIPYLDLYFALYNGISYLAIGMILLKKEKANA